MIELKNKAIEDNLYSVSYSVSREDYAESPDEVSLLARERIAQRLAQAVLVNSARWNIVGDRAVMRAKFYVFPINRFWKVVSAAAQRLYEKRTATPDAARVGADLRAPFKSPVAKAPKTPLHLKKQ